MNSVAALFVIVLLCASIPAVAQLEASFGSDCNAWVSAVRVAGERPALELLVDESITGRRRPPDVAKVRLIAEDAYRRNEEVRRDFTNVEDYVRWISEKNAERPMEYAQRYQYRITVSSNRLLVVSSNRMDRFDGAYHAIAATKHDRLYSLVTMDHEKRQIVRSVTRVLPVVYKDFPHYGCFSGDVAVSLELIWKLVSGEKGDALWHRLCANGGTPLEVGAKGLYVKIKDDVLDSREVLSIESGTDDGRGVEVLMFDKSDGRKLLLKETRSVEGVERVRFEDFVSVNGGDALYPRSIVEEKFDPSGAPVMNRVLTVRSVVALSDDDLVAKIEQELARVSGYEEIGRSVGVR